MLPDHGLDHVAVTFRKNQLIETFSLAENAYFDETCHVQFICGS